MAIAGASVAAVVLLGVFLVPRDDATPSPSPLAPSASASGSAPSATGNSSTGVTTIVVPSLDPELGITPVDLHPGTHTFERIRPRVTFEVPDEGWQAYRDYVDAAGLILLDGDEEVGGIDLGQAQVVYSEPCLSSETELLNDSPNALIEWLQSADFVETSDPTPVNLGGYSGVQIDVTPTQPDPCDVDGDLPATYLFPLGEDSYRVLDGERLRIIRLSVGDVPFLILVWAQEQDFEGFLSRTQQLIDSIEIGE